MIFKAHINVNIHNACTICLQRCVVIPVMIVKYLKKKKKEKYIKKKAAFVSTYRTHTLRYFLTLVRVNMNYTAQGKPHFGFINENPLARTIHTISSSHKLHHPLYGVFQRYLH